MRSALFCDITQRSKSVQTFRDNLLVSSLRVIKSKEPKKDYLTPLKMGPIGCNKTSVRNYRSTLRNIVEERRSYCKVDSVMD
jgi:hypothetical protein